MVHSTDSEPVNLLRCSGRKREHTDETRERRCFDESNDCDPCDECDDSEIAETHKRRRFQEPTPEISDEDAKFYEPEQLARLLHNPNQHFNDGQSHETSQPREKQAREKMHDDEGVNVQVKMGYVASCEKCANHVPGHYMHIIQRKNEKR